MPPSLGRLLPVVLASRQYSPRLELFATLANDSAPLQQVRPPAALCTSVRRMQVNALAVTVQVSRCAEVARLVDVSVRLQTMQACCWVDVHGRTATTAAELNKLLSQPAAADAAPELYEIDHLYGGSVGSVGNGGGQVAGKTAILYGAISTQCFAALHAKLVAAVTSGGQRDKALNLKLEICLHVCSHHMVQPHSGGTSWSHSEKQHIWGL